MDRENLMEKRKNVHAFGALVRAAAAGSA